MKRMLFYFLALMFVVSFNACSDDDEESSNASIVGEWTVKDVTADVTVDGEDITDFFVSLGYTQAEAEAYVTLLTSEMTSLAGTVELKEDGTYETNFDGEDTYTGVWELSSDKTTLTMDKGTEDEMIFDVVTLTDSSLTLETTDSESMDMDLDGTNETMEMIMTMNFTR